MKKLPLVLAICSAAWLPQSYAFVDHAHASIENGSAKEEKAEKSAQAGNYLAARFAQQHHDWKNAHRFIDSIMQSGIELEEIQKRAMILAMGAGEAKTAIETAEKMIASNDKNMSIAYLFLIADAFKNEDYNKAKALLQKTPVDTTSLVMSPYLNAWLGAAEGRLDVASLKDNTVQLYHGILISDFLGNHAEITGILEKSLKVEDINPHEIVRIADLYAHIGAKDKAIALYEKALKDAPDNEEIQVKISAVKNGTDLPLFEKIKSPRAGMAKAFHDIAVTLYHDYNDESACIFANMALYMNPDMVETRLLLANIAGRHNQAQEAIAFYKSVPENHKEYLSAHRKISDILADSGKTEEALATLQNLANKKKDVESQIKIGDIYRSSENFGLALEAYNKAAKMLGGKVPLEYWHLHYVRGMVYEQIGNWADAEKELKDALVLQPDHPYILNYLGYAWADRGINLEESLKMIARAVELRPSDGYIMDSLGWVKYRMGDFRGAAPLLEKAVALLPYDPTINDHLGDAYWRVGRKLEARFQWERAKNHSDEAETASIKALEQKIVSGLEEKPAILGAKK